MVNRRIALIAKASKENLKLLQFIKITLKENSFKEIENQI